MVKQIILNSTKNKNALSTSLLKHIQQELLEALKSPKVKAIWLTSSSEDYFCAGGDVKELYHAIINNDLDSCYEFFTTEYATDYLVHLSKKPIITWSDGIVFGGGLGLIQGASHRVFSPLATAAMPEVLIGLFPDVGASYFLAKVQEPWRTAISENSRRLNAAEAKHLGLCDHLISKDRDEVLNGLKGLPWTDDIEQNHILISDYLNKISTTVPAPTYHESLEEKENRAYACPTSLKFVRLQLNRNLGRGLGLNLRDSFESEWQYAYHFCHGENFKEGVRALLIDKDRKPLWRHEELTTFFEPVNTKEFEDFKKVLDKMEQYEYSI